MFLSMSQRKAGVCRSLWQLELDTSPPPTSSLPVSRYTQYTLQKILPDVFCLYLCISHPYFKVVCLAMHNACSTGVCTYTECVCSMMIQWRCIEDPYLNLTDVSSDLWLRAGDLFQCQPSTFLADAALFAFSLLALLYIFLHIRIVCWSPSFGSPERWQMCWTMLLSTMAMAMAMFISMLAMIMVMMSLWKLRQ